MTAPTEERLGVDPRLRARRQDVLRQQGRQRLRRVQVGAAVVVVGGLACGAVASPLLDVDQVIVGGADPSRIEGIEQAAGIRLGSALATVDLDRVRAAAEAVPWVDTATVTRSWPDSVLISVSERRALAAARVPGGGWVLVDADRQLASADRADLTALPTVVGAVAEARPGAPLDDAATGALGLVVLLDGVLTADGGESPRSQPEIVIGPEGDLEVSLVSSQGAPFQMRLGRPVDLEEKVRALAALLRGGVLAEPGPITETVVIDVRVPSAPVMSRPAP